MWDICYPCWAGFLLDGTSPLIKECETGRKIDIPGKLTKCSSWSRAKSSSVNPRVTGSKGYQLTFVFIIIRCTWSRERNETSNKGHEGQCEERSRGSSGSAYWEPWKKESSTCWANARIQGVKLTATLLVEPQREGEPRKRSIPYFLHCQLTASYQNDRVPQ